MVEDTRVMDAQMTPEEQLERDALLATMQPKIPAPAPPPTEGKHQVHGSAESGKAPGLPPGANPPGQHWVYENSQWGLRDDETLTPVGSTAAPANTNPRSSYGYGSPSPSSAYNMSMLMGQAQPMSSVSQAQPVEAQGSATSSELMRRIAEILGEDGGMDRQALMAQMKPQRNA